ncbi:spore protease YyaC [Bacillus piscicola]|uniref:spore protease YyaC n=1 Tax=Bacillus piscicola TaxID=1632684 RepID=UPI001F08DD5A|nr:spore protease YyaC [Bacillus piscicola]
MLGKKTISSQSSFAFQVQANAPSASSLLSEQIKKKLDPVPSLRDYVIVCIGTDRSTGDSLGPLIGSALEKNTLQNFHTYGTLAKPVHAVNLEERLTAIYEHHTNPFVIAIDACLGRLKNVGKINFSEGPVIPGAAMKKKLPHVGDMHMTGIVNVSGMMEYFVLQNTRLHTVMEMADCITEGFIQADKMLKRRAVSTIFNKPDTSHYQSKHLSGAETAFSLQDEWDRDGK